MPTTSTSDRERILDSAAAVAGPADEKDARRLLAEYFRNVLTEDLLTRSPQELFEIADSHARLARTRTGAAPVVVVHAPGAGQGTQRSSVIQIVTDDMPFLVDSVSAAVTQAGYAVRILIHPQLVPAELPGAVVGSGSGHQDAGVRQSWMRLETDAVDSPEARTALSDRIQDVLADVTAAADDAAAMSRAAQDVARALRSRTPAGQDDDLVIRAANLLEWLTTDKFVFLGYRRYDLVSDVGGDADVVLRPVSHSGLGILRAGRVDSQDRILTGRAAERAGLPQLLTVTKGNRPSRVHRPEPLDYIGIKTFDDNGAVTGEHRFLGLFDSSVYTASARSIPFLADTVDRIIAASSYTPGGALAKDLHEAIDAYPRDELFQDDSASLTRILITAAGSWHRQATRVFLREDTYGRFVSAVVLLPRDRYGLSVRGAIESLLTRRLNGAEPRTTVRIGDDPYAIINTIVRTGPEIEVSEIDTRALQDEIAVLSRPWEERWKDEVLSTHQHDDAVRVVSEFEAAFPEHYQSEFDPATAVDDVTRLQDLTQDSIALSLYQRAGSADGERRLKVLTRQQLLLTDLLPVFVDFGVEVTDERPYDLSTAAGDTFHIFDFGLRAPSPELWNSSAEHDPQTALTEAFGAVHAGLAESDPLNGLVLTAGLTWSKIVILRTLAYYLKQTGSSFSLDFVEAALNENPELARLLVELFDARFNPDRTPQDRENAQPTVREELIEQLAQVPSLNHDRVIRALLAVIEATWRTSFYRRHPGASTTPVTTALKINPGAIPNMPQPHPMAEIWVYGPRVEGVHLRFGKVARGGLRWSDRSEDFRTEVLGLVKAQMVKNAIIVPTGSKGGFVPKGLPDSTQDRDAWLEAGREAYRLFIAAMLDVTDNLVDGQIVPPERVVRLDEDDPYLVVAADKGTASFSDTANEVAATYNFWLDDAFASGGSTGYDHKAMAITARGAWESVRRHFLERGVDVQSQDFTAAGIGDMSGDVFGNGMLRSEHIRLVAAFDHRHIFIDPNPDSATGFAERQRLFELPRSSWADYNTELISAGGGVWPRTAKSISISEQVRTALGLDSDTTDLAPTALISAILRAPVDLLWNGGVGTYVKASTENNIDIGDRANDALRVDGKDLRCKVMGEGGNLGFSQLGRVEAALTGVRINTDAIDNSGGVDSSDQEVNIKILLTDPVRSGELTMDERNELLKSMTDIVAEHVLRNNYEQNVLLSNARLLSTRMVGSHLRLLDALEARGLLDRELEYLPADDELIARGEHDLGLTSPEFAVLVAYAKLALKEDLLNSDLAEDPWFDQILRSYFPEPLRGYDDALSGHALRREIIVNSVANAVINRGGVTFVNRAAAETGASALQIAKAFVICREVFGLDDFTQQVEQLDGKVPTAVQADLYVTFRRLLDQGVRVLVTRDQDLDVAAQIDRLAPMVQRLTPGFGERLVGDERTNYETRVRELVDAGVPQDLSQRTAALAKESILLDVADVNEGPTSHEDLTDLFLRLSDVLHLDALNAKARALPSDDPWDALARSALQSDLFTLLGELGRSVLRTTEAGQPVPARVQEWEAENAGALTRAREAMTDSPHTDPRSSFARLTVIIRTLRAVAG